METVIFRKCDRCGRAKTIALVTFKENVSYFFQRRQKEFSVWLCFGCMSRTFVRFEVFTILWTWYGIIGCVLGPVFIVSNIDEYICGSFLIVRASLRRRTRNVFLAKSEAQRWRDQSPECSTLTPRQEELVKKFFVAICLLDQTGDRFNADKAKRILYNCVTTDIIKVDKLADLTKCEPDVVEKWKFIFQKLLWYSGYEKLSNRLSSVTAICIFVFAIYQFFETRWIWGIGILVLVPIAKFASLLIFARLFTPGFSPLALGLTHTECRFACNEIVGHPRWND
jgi:hypothetical protein